MGSTLYILLLTIFFAVQGLKCRLEQDERSQEEFENIVRSCLKQSDFQQQHNYNSNKGNRDSRHEGNDRNNHRNNYHQTQGKKPSSYDKEENDDDADYDYNSENQNSNRRGGNDWKSQKGQYSQNNEYYANQNHGNRESHNQPQGTANNSKNIGSPLEGVEPASVTPADFYSSVVIHRNREYVVRYDYKCGIPALGKSAVYAAPARRSF